MRSKTLRVVPVFLCIAVPAFAQQKTRLGQYADQTRMAAACGPAETSFKVNLDRRQHGPVSPEAGKAQVYFIHVAGIPFEHLTAGYPTTKYALDGSWVGAGHGDSWFALAPGEHHVCATLQSLFVDQRVELAHFMAEAGKSYFFRTHLVMSGSVELLELDQIDSDEGGYLIGSYPQATAHPKK